VSNGFLLMCSLRASNLFGFAVERQLEADRLKTMSLSFSIALNQLPLGEYDCQVTVLDPTAQKAAFWRAPVKLVP